MAKKKIDYGWCHYQVCISFLYILWVFSRYSDFISYPKHMHCIYCLVVINTELVSKWIYEWMSMSWKGVQSKPVNYKFWTVLRPSTPQKTKTIRKLEIKQIQMIIGSNESFGKSILKLIVMLGIRNKIYFLFTSNRP